MGESLDQLVAIGSAAEIPEEKRPARESAARHFMTGLELGDDGNWREAIAEFDNAIRLDPYLASAHARRGLALAELGEDDNAIASIEKAITLTSDRDTIAGLEDALMVLRERR